MELPSTKKDWAINKMIRAASTTETSRASAYSLNCDLAISVPPTFPVGRLEKEECHPHSPWERFSPGYRRSSLMRAALPERSLR